ncbi:DUF1858 domain-containing protein [Haliovirga abyssi]|uniref:Disulfide oxidoreductase n=1 Tax=Haliovirga abyssi TaxID=2996794 RepID=A0AAU9D7V8_9FUSO|nr:DUF1858 domain-containing protein [Haliovirga abyssi]BDU50658.1 disulfide oxidoreductase [Haliovirga abyssi]
MAKVTTDMNILEAVQKYPEINGVFAKYGLGCIGCMVAAGESIGEGISAHGLNADVIVDEINEILGDE